MPSWLSDEDRELDDWLNRLTPKGEALLCLLVAVIVLGAVILGSWLAGPS